jgi:hypothetical protein
MIDFASAILNSRYPERAEGSNSTSNNILPVHNQFSHYRTALEYLTTYLLENENKYNKKETFKDLRPKRNYVT